MQKALLGFFLQEESADQYLAPNLVSPAEYWGFWSSVSLHDSRPAGNRQDTPFSKGEQELWTAVNRTHWKSLELGLKVERDKTRVIRDKPGRTMPMFEGQCATKVLQSAVLVKAADGGSYDSKDGMGYWCFGNHRSTWEWSHKNQGFFPWKGSRINRPTEAHLHQCTQHGQQTGVTGSCHTAGKLLESCHHRNMG